MKTSLISSNKLMQTAYNHHKPFPEIGIPKGRIWRLAGDHRGQSIRCVKGTLWITQARDLKDYVLTNGETFQVNSRDSILVEAMQDSRLRITT